MEDLTIDLKLTGAGAVSKGLETVGSDLEKVGALADALTAKLSVMWQALGTGRPAKVDLSVGQAKAAPPAGRPGVQAGGAMPPVRQPLLKAQQAGTLATNRAEESLPRIMQDVATPTQPPPPPAQTPAKNTVTTKAAPAQPQAHTTGAPKAGMRFPPLVPTTGAGKSLVNAARQAGSIIVKAGKDFASLAGKSQCQKSCEGEGKGEGQDQGQTDKQSLTETGKPSTANQSRSGQSGGQQPEEEQPAGTGSRASKRTEQREQPAQSNQPGKQELQSRSSAATGKPVTAGGPGAGASGGAGKIFDALQSAHSVVQKARAAHHTGGRVGGGSLGGSRVGGQFGHIAGGNRFPDFGKAAMGLVKGSRAAGGALMPLAGAASGLLGKLAGLLGPVGKIIGVFTFLAAATNAAAANVQEFSKAQLTSGGTVAETAQGKSTGSALGLSQQEVAQHSRELSDRISSDPMARGAAAGMGLKDYSGVWGKTDKAGQLNTAVDSLMRMPHTAKGDREATMNARVLGLEWALPMRNLSEHTRNLLKADAERDAKVFDPETAKNSQELTTAFGRLASAGESLVVTAFKPMIPVVVKVVDWLTRFVDGIAFVVKSIYELMGRKDPVTYGSVAKDQVKQGLADKVRKGTATAEDKTLLDKINDGTATDDDVTQRITRSAQAKADAGTATPAERSLLASTKTQQAGNRDPAVQSARDKADGAGSVKGSDAAGDALPTNPPWLSTPLYLPPGARGSVNGTAADTSGQVGRDPLAGSWTGKGSDGGAGQAGRAALPGAENGKGNDDNTERFTRMITTPGTGSAAIPNMTPALVTAFQSLIASLDANTQSIHGGGARARGANPAAWTAALNMNTAGSPVKSQANFEQMIWSEAGRMGAFH